jgi:hypothetical protein
MGGTHHHLHAQVCTLENVLAAARTAMLGKLSGRAAAAFHARWETHAVRLHEALTSQFFANIHLDGFDHFLKQELRVKGYVRYVDDFLIKSPALRAGCAGAPGSTAGATCAPRAATTTTPRTRTTPSGSALPVSLNRVRWS